MGINESTETPAPNPETAEQPPVPQRRRSQQVARSPEGMPIPILTALQRPTTICNACFVYVSGENAGFTQQWAAASSERTARRQVEVQANVANNANRAPEYRTVTTHQTPNEPNQYEAEESERNTPNEAFKPFPTTFPFTFLNFRGRQTWTR